MKTSGNTILITGGTSGIGFALAKAFIESGNEVIICSRSEERLGVSKKLVPGLHVIKCDVSSKSDRDKLFARVNEEFPALNMLINNAGVQKSINLNDADDTARRVSEEVEINFIAPVHLSSLFIPLLSKQPESAIINITSGLAFAPIAIYPVYCATKAALHSFSMSLRYRLLAAAIKVFEIAPPLVKTALKEPADNDHPEMNAHGIDVQIFVDEAIKAIEGNIYEYAVGQAENMRQKREEMFPVMNPPVK